MARMDPAWSFDPAKIDLTGEATEACDLDFDLDAHDRARPLASGTWWVVPFAKTSSHELVGIRMMPGLPLSESPVVMVHAFEVQTLASRPAHLVPLAIFRMALALDDGFEHMRRLSTKVWAELERLHAALGGTDSLATVRAAVGDDALLARSKTYGSTLEEVLAEIYPQLDPTPETAAYRAYVRAAVAGAAAPLPLSPAMGSWRAAAATTAFVVHRIFEEDRVEQLLEAAWDISCQPPALDCFQGYTPSQLSCPSGTSPRKVPLEAARALAEREELVPASWRKDPLWPAVRALADAGEDYDATAHLDAAEHLRAAGQPERVYAALTAVEYWRTGLSRKPFPRIADAASLLAEEQGWNEIAHGIRANIAAGAAFVAPKKARTAKKLRGVRKA